jgi:MarC family membrane protein
MKDQIVNEISNAFLLVFAGLFPVVNPLGAAPLFLSLTADRTPPQRARLAMLVALNSFWLLVGSTLFGSLILEFFGISIPVVRVAGGMLVTAMGWKLLSEGGSSSHEPLHDAAEAGVANDSFYPLTLPLTVGPGAISVAFDRQPSSARSVRRARDAACGRGTAWPVRDRAGDLRLLPVCRAAGALSRRGWRQRAGTVVGVHSGLHWDTDRLERPERTVYRTATPGRIALIHVAAIG